MTNPTPLHRANRDPRPIPGWLTEQREKTLRTNLVTLPDLAALVITAVIPDHNGNDGSGSRPVPSSRPTANLAAVDLLRHIGIEADPIAAVTETKQAGRRAGILDTLTSWVRLAEGEIWDEGLRQPQPLVEPPTITGECSWLAREIVWILEQQWVIKLAEDLEHLVNECRHVLHIRPEYKPRCDRCGWTLEARSAGSYYCCSGCGRTVEHWAEMKRIAELQAPMTLTTMALAIDVPVKTLHRWHTMGLIEPVDATATKRGRHFDPYQARHVKTLMGRHAEGMR